MGLRHLAAGAMLFVLGVNAHADPLKIAIVEPFSGPLERSGYSFAEGVRYAVKKINQSGGFNGEPVQLKEYDNLGKTAVAQEKLKEAINDGNHLVMSVTVSAISAMLTDEIKKYNTRNPGKEVIFYNIGSASIDLVQEKCHFFAFKWGANAWMNFHTAARVMNEAGVLGKKIYVINPNYSYGHDSETAQREIAKTLGAEVVGADLVELLKTQDFSPYVAKVKASGAQSILTALFENDLTLFLKALDAAGLKLPLANQSLDAPGTLAAAGQAALGSYLARIWVRGVGGDAGEALLQDFTKEMGHPPLYETPSSLFPTLFIAEAGKRLQLKGGPIDTKALVLALEQTTMKTPAGDISVRKEDHQGLRPMTISVVSTDTPYKVDGTDMGFKPIKTVNSADAAVPLSPACKMERPPGT